MDTTPEQASFTKQFGAGVIGWLASMLIIFGLAWVVTSPETVSTAFMWTISYWWAGFIVGVLALLIVGMASKQPFGRALGAYLFPVALVAALAAICLSIYPDRSFADQVRSYLPVGAVFYVLGWAWIIFRKAPRELFIRSVLPPAVGGVILLALVAIPVFRSNAFVYRNAFELDVQKVTEPEGSIVAEVVLNVQKAGNYDFRASAYGLFDYHFNEEYDPEKAAGKITWGEAGEPGEGATGKFPLTIRWDKSAISLPEAPLAMEAESVTLEVREASNPDTVVTMVSAPLRPVD